MLVLADDRETTDLLIAQLGKDRLADDVASDDFEQLLSVAAERWGPVRQGNFVTCFMGCLSGTQ